MFANLKQSLLKNYDILSNKQFMTIITARSLLLMCQSVRALVMGWYIYDNTGNPFYLAILSMCEALPHMTLVGFGGYLSDKYSRKWLTIFYILGIAGLTAVLCYLVTLPLTDQTLYAIFGTFSAFGVVRGVLGGATLQSLMLLVVPREHVQKATVWDGIFNKASVIAGPIIGGLVYKHYDVVGANGVMLIFMALALFFVFFIVDVVVLDEDPAKTPWQTIIAGFTFIFSRPALKATVLLDFVAVIFSGVTGLLPVFVKDILHLGPEELGYLRSSINIGALCAGLFLAHYSLRNRVGRQFIMAVVLYCISLLLFAFSTNFYLSIAFLFLSGYFDWYGTMIRSSMARLLTPDHIQGRVNSARSLFAASANEISTFESGLLAGFIGPVPSVVTGVIITLMAIAFTWKKSPIIREIKMEDLVLVKS